MTTIKIDVSGAINPPLTYSSRTVKEGAKIKTAYAATSANDNELYAAGGALCLSTMSGIAETYGDFTVAKSSTGRTSAGLTISIPVAYRYLLLTLANSAAYSAEYRLINRSTGKQLESGYIRRPVYATAAAPRKEETTSKTIQISESVTAGTTYRLKFTAKAVGSVSAIDLLCPVGSFSNADAAKGVPAAEFRQNGYTRVSDVWSYRWA